MSITAFQVNGGLVTPLADRKLYSYLSNDDVGILTGTSTCENHQTYIRVTSGWGIIKGCVFRIVQEDIEIELPDDASPYIGRLGIRLNIASANPVEFFQEYVAGLSPTAFRDLDQQDINNGGQVYEFVLKYYTLSNTGLAYPTNTWWNNIPTPTVIGVTGHYPVVNADPSGYPRVDVFFADVSRPGNAPAYLAARAYDEEGDAGYAETEGTSSVHKIIDEYGTFLPRIGELRGNIDGTPGSGSYEFDVAKDTYVNVGSFKVPPGRWLINVSARFENPSSGSAGSTGYREVIVTNSSGGSSAIYLMARDILPAISGMMEYVHMHIPYENTTDSTKTLYISAKQTSGATLKVRCVKNLIRLSDQDRWEALGDVTEYPVSNT